MNSTDTMQTFQNLENLSFEEKKAVYTKLFSLGANTSKSLEEKIELIKLICFFTHTLQKKDSNKYYSSKVVLEAILPKDMRYDLFIISYSCICDDLLYQVDNVENPGYENSKKLIERIKQLVDQWIPF